MMRDEKPVARKRAEKVLSRIDPRAVAMARPSGAATNARSRLEATVPGIVKNSKDISTNIHNLGGIFQKNDAGNRQQFSGLTEAGKMLWNLVNKMFSDDKWILSWGLAKRTST